MTEWDIYQEKMKIKYPEAYENAIKNEALFPESDRGATLIAASLLEEQLTKVLYSFLRDTKSTELLLDGFNAPIGHFSSKIQLAHALGLIEDDEYKQLEGLRKIRNIFAHNFENINFKTQKIKDLIEGNLIKSSDKHDDMRELFFTWFLNINLSLLYRTKEVLSEKRISRTYVCKPIKDIKLIEVDEF